MSSFSWSSSASNPDAPLALLLPGTGYTVKAPLLYWCAEMLTGRGWHVEAVQWETGIDAEARADADPIGFVEAEIESVVKRLGRRPGVIVAKSFGSCALPWAVEHGTPGVWLTPALVEDPIRRALESAPACHFAAGGDEDPMWQPALSLTTSATLLTLPGADHSVLVGTGWEGSLETQSRLLSAVEAHVATSVPAP